MAFANAILTKDPTFGVIGLVPCAIGGTKISNWGKGTFHYKQLVMRAAASLQYGGTIQALLWYQGESDTVSEEDAKSYKAKLQRLFLNLRHDLQSPTLPIIQVALASGSGVFIDTVREAQLGIDLLNLRTVDAKGLPLQPDTLHLSTPAQVRLGEMLAETFLQFLPSTGPISSPTPIGGVGSCCNPMLQFLMVPLSSMMVLR
ncbi:hypothetical protein CJ030_MR6G011285 [Morella rubra]|uniref:Sialate O-acetylesterase domain-containing protein n=1 Tax=Morella rubra TaxID=262757 RepID=A0A6A1V7L9_9ROSI|nr:hypothetical protein CJ030_MR6G011285 [Morella rubra]